MGLFGLRLGIWLVVFATNFNPPTYASPIQLPPPPPPFSYPPEDFGFHDFSPTSDQLRLARVSKIASVDEYRLWVSLLGLMKSNSGYHTRGDVEAGLGRKMTLVAKEVGLENWKSTRGTTRLFLNEANQSKLFGTSSRLEVSWNSDLQRPDCVSAAKAFTDIQMAGGMPLQEVIANAQARAAEPIWTYSFRLPSSEKVYFSSQGLSDNVCVSYFRLDGAPF